MLLGPGPLLGQGWGGEEHKERACAHGTWHSQPRSHAAGSVQDFVQAAQRAPSPPAAAPRRAAPRVAGQYDQHFFAQDHAEEKDHTDEVLRKCEEIAKALHKKLGGNIKDGDRWGAGAGAGGRAAEARPKGAGAGSGGLGGDVCRWAEGFPRRVGGWEARCREVQVLSSAVGQ